MSVIYCTIAILIGLGVGSIKNKTMKSSIISVLMVAAFIAVIYLMSQPLDNETERSYISTSFNELSDTVTFSEPMRVTIRTKKNIIVTSTEYIISPIDIQ